MNLQPFIMTTVLFYWLFKSIIGTTIGISKLLWILFFKRKWFWYLIGITGVVGVTLHFIISLQ